MGRMLQSHHNDSTKPPPRSFENSRLAVQNNMTAGKFWRRHRVRCDAAAIRPFWVLGAHYRPPNGGVASPGTWRNWNAETLFACHVGAQIPQSFLRVTARAHSAAPTEKK